MDLQIVGNKKLKGTVITSTSKNGAVVLLCASLLNMRKTTLKNVPKIEEVYRIIEVLESIGVSVLWRGEDVVIIPPQKVNLRTINKASAVRTRSILMFIGPLIHSFKTFKLPRSGGCKLGIRTVGPHLAALEDLGVTIDTLKQHYAVKIKKLKKNQTIVLYESGDTVTENAIMAASRIQGKTVIKYASANYSVQELCFFLSKLGVRIDGIGTTTLTVHGKRSLNRTVTYYVSEDPTDTMFFLAAAIVTNSGITIKRCPMEFLELELLTLSKMGFTHTLTKSYKARNGKTNLVDIKTLPSKLCSPPEKIHPRPYPGLNIDNLPFFAVIATRAKGETLIHDWVFEKRALYYTLLNKLGAKTKLLDQHRLLVKGPTTLKAAKLTSPPALRPAAVLLIGMLGAQDTSILKDMYMINRGYENLVKRLTSLGAKVKILQ